MKNSMRVGIAGLFAGFAAIATSGASAADLPVRAPAPAPLFAQAMNWTGFYAGIHAAYHDGSISQVCFGLCPVNPKITGAYLGVNGGFDYQFANNVVVGAMVVVPVTRLYATYNLAPGVTFKLSTRFAGLLAGRVGYAIDNFLPYVFAGYEFANVRVTNNAAPIQLVNKSHDGWAIGAGVEYAINRNWSVDARYMYSELPNRGYNFGGGPEAFGEKSHTIQLGVNYRFGGPAPAAVVAKY